MLSKLLKYEISATARIFLPVYGLILLLAVINKFFWNSHIDYLGIPRAILINVYVMAIIAAFVITLLVTIQRFYKNLLGDEGYLSFTLPVKVHSHIDAKMIVTLIWIVLSVLVSIISAFIFWANADTLTGLSRMCAGIREVYQTCGLPAYLITLEFIILAIVGTLSSILKIYVAIVMGQLVKRHKILVGIGAYLALNIIEQTVTSILFTAFNRQILAYFELFDDSFPILQTEMGLLICILYVAIYGVIFYSFTTWMLSKRLNLE